MEVTYISSLSASDQEAIVCEVFATMAGIDITASRVHIQVVDPISSTLDYSEAFEGTIVIDCSPQLAYLFTQRLMLIDSPSSLDEDVEDAVGELTNMIGGNLKGLLPPETSLSTPRVISIDERCQLFARSKQLSHTCFRSEVGRCCVSLLRPLSAGISAT